jgi:DNA uptake protein ComE-like DNA-binding protein
MSRSRKITQAMLERIERRFRRSRPGSVLILVVALLVLLALLGTAYINTAQTDRYSSAQNSFNTEIDLLVQGVEDITIGAVDSALFGKNSLFHQETDSKGNPTGYSSSDYPLNPQSAFIGDRYPTLLNLATTPNTTNNYPWWQFISALPDVKNFESPYLPSNATGNPFLYTARTQMAPTSIAIVQTATGDTQNFPAFQYYDPKAATYYTVLAGDADGDGIADCALFRLSVGQINGVTYYGGVRVIDDSAALNAATAWQPNALASVPSGTIPGNFYPDNLDFNGLLVTGDSLTTLNTYRWNGASAPSLTPYDERETTPAAPPAAAPTSAQARSDFSFGNTYEAFWMQLGRRIANPGYISQSTQYQALPLSEMQAMARKFILHDPTVAAAASSSSTLEQDLPASLFNNSPSMPYQPNQSLLWYTTNFDFVNGTNVPIRSMLVTQNAVSNFVYSKLYSRGTYAAGTTYNFGDWVYNPASAGGDNRSYVCLQQTSSIAPSSTNVLSAPYWEMEPWVSGPTKVSANTATFGQLWMGYFSAMSLPVTTNPIPTSPPPACQTNIVPNTDNAQTQGMFRASLRSSAPPSNWGPAQELQLRAALAAINTLDVRDTDDDVTSRNIMISDATGAPAFNVMVYGTEKEPYITEVYASNDTGGSAAAAGGPSPTPPAGGPTGATNSYMAIELYNPYSTPITLLNWQLAAIPRGGATLTPTAIPTSWTSAATAPTIPANGYIVIASSATPPTYAAATPPAATVAAKTLYVVPGLATATAPATTTAFNNELVLLRPRLANGTLGSSTVATNTYNEATLTDLVPVDSYDFTGLLATETDPGHEWHYVRPSLTSAGKAWHFVYPGKYDPAKGQDSTHPRQYGTQVGTGQSLTDLSSLGVGDAGTLANAVNLYPIDRPLQIANQDFGGPKSVGNYPYGAFARNADLLQVTYIGAYRIDDINGNMLELNPVTLDSAMANDQNMDNDVNAPTSEAYGRQNIGRFCPVHWGDTVTAGTPPTPVTTTEMGYTAASLFDDYGYNFVASASVPAQPLNWPTQTAYNWTLDLFDYFTVQSPQDDYLPDTDPLKYTTAPGATAVSNSSYLVANAQAANDPNSATEEAVPVHGRININTANWRTLATLPLFDNPPNQPAAADMAKAIVYYRDIDDGTTPGTPHPHGPFQSIDELNNVPVTAASSPTVLTTAGTTFRNAFGQYLGTFTVPGPHGSNVDGDLSPFNAGATTTPGADMVYGDFENQNLALNRISNLITTRSDSFTAYIIVQGWRTVGTQTPQLVVQRRAAFIIDRSLITPANNTEPSINNVPVN